MGKSTPLISNFGSGEVSPLFQGRVEAARYKTAVDTMLNYHPTIQGGVVRRSGTSWAAISKDSTKKSRLQAFEFSTTQAYMIEFGSGYIRFYKDNGAILETAKNITGATTANPVVITSNAHGFSNGESVEIVSVGGMTQLNGRRFVAANVTANTFQLSGINGTGYTAYTSGGTVSRVYEISSSYTEADLFQLKFTQSADTLYIAHPSYAPRKLTRTAHTSWALTPIVFGDGPYLNANILNDGSKNAAITITPSATTGAGITLTASAPLFVTVTDIGRYVRIFSNSLWGYAKITATASTTSVTADVVNAFGNTSASSNWRLGLWSGSTGYPSAVCFHEDRLIFAGTPNFSQRYDASITSDYENFQQTKVDGTNGDSYAYFSTLNSNTVNAVRWMTSDEKGLLLGSASNEWIARPSSLGAAMTPSNVSQKQVSAYGSADIQPIQAGKATQYVQRASKKLRELLYFYDNDGFQSTDMTLLSEHIAGPGFTQMCFQKSPQSFIWLVRSDGQLCSMTYERDIESLRAGWSRHVLGGTSDAAGNDAVVESIACIPSPDGLSDQVWVIVKRYINGATVRYIEYLNNLFGELDEQKDGVFLDCSLGYDNPLEISGATKANPVVVTSGGHGLSNGDQVLFSDIAGMTELNTNTYKVANVTVNTFELTTTSGTNIDGTGFGTYISGGHFRKYVSVISGLWHLIGETVGVLADGAAQPDLVVGSGASVTLTSHATTICLGYNYNSDLKLLRFESGAANGAALTKVRKSQRTKMLVYRTLGVKIGFSFDELDELTFRKSSDPMSRAVPLFSGVISESVSSGDDRENQLCIRQSQPFPGMILGISPQMDTQDWE